MNTVFLSKEKGLTSTSANHIANMAKEAYQKLEAELTRLSFTNETAKVAFSGETLQTQIGTTSSDLNKIEPIINEMARLKSLIAWLREAIKAREEMTIEVRSRKAQDFVAFPPEPEFEPFNEEAPTEPNYPEIITDGNILNSWPIDKRVKYETLKTKVTNLGKLVHPNGVINNARKNASQILSKPNRVEGTGRDLVIYSCTPSVSTEEVDTLFFELQAQHREAQKEFNAMQHEIELAVQEINDANQADYTKAYNQFATEYQAYQERKDAYAENVLNTKKQWRLACKECGNQAEDMRVKELHEIQSLKIVIPESLEAVYKQVAALGK